MRILACIEDAAVIEKIPLTSMRKLQVRAARPPPCRAPPARAFG
jgi:hypothetical protein